MADANIVNPGDSSYSLPQSNSVPVGDVPGMSMDRVLPRQQSTGLSRGVQQLGSPNVFVDSGNEQIIVAKTDGGNVTTNQVLMGNQVNFGEGFYVTKPGIDATTAKSTSDFVFNSNQNVFKIVRRIDTSTPSFVTTWNGSATTGGVILTVAHGQSYTPIVSVYVRSFLLSYDTGAVLASTYIPLPIFYGTEEGFNTYCFPNSSGSNYYAGTTILFAADQTNVYIQAYFNSSANIPDTIAAIPTTIFINQETAATT